MRFLFGLVVGVGLLIGGVYIRDSSIDVTRDPSARTIVNWDVASGVIKLASDWMREQIGWIGQQLHRQS